MKNVGANNYGIKVGDIFVSEWGATMSLVDFYQVVELRGGNTLVLQGLKKDEVGDGGFLTGWCTPRKGDFVKQGAITKRVGKSQMSGRPYVRLTSYSVAFPYDPGRKYNFNHCD